MPKSLEVWCLKVHLSYCSQGSCQLVEPEHSLWIDTVCESNFDYSSFDTIPSSKVGQPHFFVLSICFYFLTYRASVQFEATKCFLSNNKETESADLPPERSWYHAMLYYMYPSETAPCRSSSVLKNGFMSKSRIACEEDNNESDFYKYYLQQWQDALRAAYHNYRLKAKTSPTLQLRSYFYVHTTEYTVCFYGESPKCEGSDAAKFSSFQKSFVEVYRQRYCGENSNIHQEQGKNKYKFRAVVTQSNARLRKDLTEANVSFRMPFCRSSEIQCQPISSDPPMRVSDTALVFEGHLQIHGLYEYLLNQKGKPRANIWLYMLIHFSKKHYRKGIYRLSTRNFPSYMPHCKLFVSKISAELLIRSSQMSSCQANPYYRAAVTSLG